MGTDSFWHTVDPLNSRHGDTQPYPFAITRISICDIRRLNELCHFQSRNRAFWHVVPQLCPTFFCFRMANWTPGPTWIEYMYAWSCVYHVYPIYIRYLWLMFYSVHNISIYIHMQSILQKHVCIIYILCTRIIIRIMLHQLSTRLGGEGVRWCHQSASKARRNVSVLSTCGFRDSQGF